MLNQTTITIIGIVAYIVLAPLLGGLLAGIDRKITARMQGRQGPPILQSFYDVTKLINKKTFIVNNMQHFLVFSFLIFVILTGALFFGGFDILLVFFTLTTAAMFLVIAATSANSPYSSMGAQRELAQMLAYEPMVLLAAVGLYMATGSFRVSDIVQADVSAIAYLPVVFFGFLYILTIKLRKSPFDLSTSHHAHQEMVKGISTELSGGVLALMEVAHWYENILLLGIVGLFIVNSTWWSVIIAVAVCIVAYFVEILIDNTSARVKWNLMFKSAWGITIVFGAINILVLQFIK
jgi:ech hydrogenase subunit B